MSLHQPRQRVLSQQVGSLQNDSKHKRIQSAMEEINHNAPSPNNNGSNLKHGINHTNGNGNGNGQSGNNRSATIPIPSPSRHFRSLSNNTTNTKKPSLSVATSFQLQKPSLDFSITAPAYGVNSIPSANNDVGILKSALPEGVGFSDGLGLSDMTDGRFKSDRTGARRQLSTIKFYENLIETPCIATISYTNN